LDAGHDNTGNPRRCFVAIDRESGEVDNVVDEGYAGESVMSSYYDDYVMGPRFQVPVSEYKGLLRRFKDKKPRT
jgi:hypothetical protein